MSSAYAVIMAGGRGTRFWPMSRKVQAKQFLRLIDGRSFLEHTISRLEGLIDPSHILIVGNQDQAHFLTEQAAGIPSENILLEPCGRNTAPCIAWAAKEILRRDSTATMLVLPADHMITPKTAFHKSVQSALDFLNNAPDSLITMGIVPTFAHTGYGYIHAQSSDASLSKVLAFKEKPDEKTAHSYLESGEYFWNAGIFLWKVAEIMRLIQQHIPDLYAGVSVPDFIQNYAALPSVSVDYGILEHAASQLYVQRAAFQWNDIGSWEAMRTFWPEDAQQNASPGTSNLHLLNSHGNTVYASDKAKHVALMDVDDLIVIDSADALLITPRRSDQKIKALVDRLPDTLL
jgi:mannose-1-phosphate guanylyltransferase